MIQIATNTSQSARLIACGVDLKTADMMHTPHNTLSTDRYNPLLKDRAYTPAWSLSALLALMPKVITDENGDEYHISLAYERPMLSEYDVAYKPCWFNGEDIMFKHDNCPIEACVQMIEWLTTNNFKLNNNE